MMEFASAFVGIPYVKGGRDMAGLDCWGFVQAVYAAHLNISLPVLPGLDTDDTLTTARLIQEGEFGGEWARLRQPLHMCLVGMARNNVFHHVGLWCGDSGQVLHAVPGQGIVGHRLSSLRVRSFRRIEFYKHKCHE